MSVSIEPKGRTFVRLVIAKCVAGELEASDYAARRWRPSAAATQILRSAVVGMPLSSSNLYGAAEAEFLDIVRPQTLIGKLAGLRRVPLGVRITQLTSGATAGWLGEGAGIPFGALRFSTTTLDPAKLGAIVVSTAELARFSDPAAEAVISNDLVAQVVAFSDEQFVDPSVSASAGVHPASITNGVSGTASTANVAKDLNTLISAFTGDIEKAYLITDPITAAQIGLARDSNGAFLFPDCGPRGGSVVGVPVLTSRGVPRPLAGSPTIARGLLILCDPSGICVGDGGIEVAASEQATLVMDTAPTTSSTGLGLSPTAPSAANMVSLYQSNAIGIRCIRTLNWLKARSNAVALITGCTYVPS